MNKKHLHFMGIGGIGMSGIARWYHAEGFHVSGCDFRESETVQALRAEGIPVHIGHDASHVQDVDVLVSSMAVPLEHPEIQAANSQGIPHLRRIRLLADIFDKRKGIGITGTHGKSTTTGMLSHILMQTDIRPSLLIGASLPLINGNYYHGTGDYLVAEVDESDPGFGDIASYLGVITNLEADHIAGEFEERRNYHASLEELEKITSSYIAKAETLLYCADWQRLEALCHTHPRAYRYGKDADNLDYAVRNLRMSQTETCFDMQTPRASYAVRLPLLGEYNALNAVAALAVVDMLEMPLEPAIAALETFTGIGRRFQEHGRLRGAPLIDDYAHHPTEIQAALSAAKQTGRRVRAILQPHRWIRTAQQWPEMAAAACIADEVVVTDIYAASEQPIAGVSAQLIVAAIAEAGVPVRYASLAEAEEYFAETLAEDDLLITLGAGDVYKVLTNLLARKDLLEHTIIPHEALLPSSDALKNKKITTDVDNSDDKVMKQKVIASPVPASNRNNLFAADKATLKIRRTKDRQPTVLQMPLAKLTTLGVGGEVELWRVESEADLREATAQPYRILGAGSNILASDAGVPERVIKLGRSYNSIRDYAGEADVWLGAATPLPGLVRRTAEAGLSGLEGLLGVPAVLGGAIAMNAGTRYGEMSDVVQEVELFMDGALHIVPAASLNLRYRHSEIPQGAIITRARLKLTPSTPEAVQAKLEQVDNARKGQPKIKSAGCAFKNPVGDSAGRLIDGAGLKGLQVGQAMVSHEHANFIVNLGGATAQDVVTLLAQINHQLEQPLETEWELWGFAAAEVAAIARLEEVAA